MDYLDTELKQAENSLVKKLILKEKRTRGGNQDQDNIVGDCDSICQLQNKIDSLIVAQDYALFVDSATSVTSSLVSSNYDSNEDKIFAQVNICYALAEIIVNHADNLLDIFPQLYENAYVHSFEYVHQNLVVMVREKLQSSRYPNEKGCRELLDEPHHLSEICKHLTNLEAKNEEVLKALEVEGFDTTGNESILVEFFHPLLDRIFFHFVNNDVANRDLENQEPRLTATRIDRLPEWLLHYINKNVLQEGGPYEVVIELVGPHLAMQFCQELIRLVQWIIVEKRNFFDDFVISGLKSNPQILLQAIEQFLEFDANLMELISNATRKNTVDCAIRSEIDTLSFVGLMDVLVTTNDRLFDWWLERERESVFSTLFPDDDDDEHHHDDVLPIALASHISPRAELFCALIQSLKIKASTLSNPSRYLKTVAVPLCSQFVDTLHHTSVNLRSRLAENFEHDIGSDINEWIEVINGTKLASDVLSADTFAKKSQSDHDLARFGRSLERLVEVLMDEFAVTFVETTLMDHAKFANYLMLASHLLANPEWDVGGISRECDLTIELEEADFLLQRFRISCDAITQGQNSNTSPSSKFAPLGMRTRVVNRIVDKLLDIALDIDGVTPDIWLKGATVFARDVSYLLGEESDMLIDRLLDVTRLMTMDYELFYALFNALCDLMGSSNSFIDIQDLTADDTLREEAISMLKAKDISCPLDYAVSIMNRRRN